MGQAPDDCSLSEEHPGPGSKESDWPLGRILGASRRRSTPSLAGPRTRSCSACRKALPSGHPTDTFFAQTSWSEAIVQKTAINQKSPGMVLAPNHSTDGPD